MSPGSGMAQRGSHYNTDNGHHSSLGHRSSCRNPAGPEVVNIAKFTTLQIYYIHTVKNPGLFQILLWLSQLKNIYIYTNMQQKYA